MAFLELTGIRKSYAKQLVVRQFDLAAERGEFISFLGPSGCGKTTTLRMVAGFETPNAGTIHIDGRDITHLRPNQRNVGMVFQSYALFPNMTIAENVAFGLKIAKWSAADIGKRVQEMLDLIKLPQLAQRYPYQLSGGQQQRVALARALAVKPQVLLLDEPLSALDAKIRASLREEIRALQRELGITTIYVTHDQEEALSMSDRIVVMNEGRVEQIGTPFEIYSRPQTRFAASFVGTLNILKGQIRDPEAGRFLIGDQEVIVKGGFPGARAGDPGAISLRPESATIESLADPAGALDARRSRIKGKIEEVIFLGAIIRLRVRLHDNLILLDTFNSVRKAPPARGSDITISLAPEDLLILKTDIAPDR